MDKPSSAEVLLQDALTATTRRMRTSLLVSSALGLIMAKTGLIPSRIVDLGIEFTATHKASLVLIVLFGVVYFFVAFLLYAASDFSRWQLALRTSFLKKRAIENRSALFKGMKSKEDRLLNEAAGKAQLEKALQESMDRYMSPYWQIAAPLGWARAFLEFVFPLVFAAYSIYLLAVLSCAI
jgi:hypothetical protein